MSESLSNLATGGLMAVVAQGWYTVAEENGAGWKQAASPNPLSFYKLDFVVIDCKWVM